MFRLLFNDCRRQPMEPMGKEKDVELNHHPAITILSQDDVPLYELQPTIAPEGGGVCDLYRKSG